MCVCVCACVLVCVWDSRSGELWRSLFLNPHPTKLCRPPSKSNLNPSQPFSCLLWSRVLLFFSSSFPSCSASYCKLQCIPSLFGFIPLLHTVPWVPKGDRQRMRTLIVTPARAKPCIFNLLWHYSPSLSLFPSHPRSFFLYTITLSILSASHSLIHTQQRHFTWDPQTSVSHLPLVPAPCTLCVYINVLGCLHVCELQSPLQCSCASGLHNLCHGQRGGVCIHWPSAISKRLAYAGPSHWQTCCPLSANVCSWN